MAEARPPFPPFTEETARPKVQAAEDGWNTRDPERVSLAYTRTRCGATGTGSSPDGPDRGVPAREVGARAGLRAAQGLWAYQDARIAVRFQYECRDA